MLKHLTHPKCLMAVLENSPTFPVDFDIAVGCRAAALLSATIWKVYPESLDKCDHGIPWPSQEIQLPQKLKHRWDTMGYLGCANYSCDALNPSPRP